MKFILRTRLHSQISGGCMYQHKILDESKTFFGNVVNGQARRKRGAEGALAPPVFGRTVNPISTRGSRLCPPQYYEPPRIFRPCDGPAKYVCKFCLHILVQTVYKTRVQTSADSGSVFISDKGSLISESFSRFLQSPKKCAKNYSYSEIFPPKEEMLRIVLGTSFGRSEQK
jgi:hypothetical protein